MANDLRIRVILDMAERALAPLRRVQGGSNDAAKALRAARDRLKELNAQQAQVGDFRTLRAGLRDTSQQLAQAQQRVADMARAYAQAGPPTKALARDFAAAKREAASLGQQHARQSQQAQQLRDKLTAAGMSARDMGQHERRLRADIAATTAAIEKQTGKLRDQAAQQRKLAALRERHAKAMMHTGMLAGAGLAIQAAGSRGKQAAMQPVMTYSQHEDAMLGIARQVPGARDAGGQLTQVYRDVEQQIRNLSKEIPLPTTQIAMMMTAAARMEVPTDKLKGFTLTVSQMATAFDAVPDEIAESMGKVAKNFNIPLTEITGLADTINYLDDNAISKGADIINYLNRVSGVAALAKMRASDYAALGSTLLTLGERTETAGTATNAIIQKLAAASKGTKKFQGAIAELGLDSMMIQKGMATDAMGTLLEVFAALQKLPEHQRLGVMVDLVGLEHSDTLAKLADKLPELQRQRGLANSNEAKGSMAREAAARNATLSAQWQMARNRAFNLGAVIGQTLVPAVTDLLRNVNPLIERITAWVQANPGLVGGLLKAVLVLSALMATTGAILVPLALVVGKAMVMRFLFARLSLTLASAAGQVGMLGRVLSFAGGLMSKLFNGLLIAGRVLLANPLFLALGLLATAAYLVYTRWDGIKGGLVAIWETVSDGVSAVWDGMKARAAATWQALGGSFPAALATISASIINWSPLGLFYQAFAGVLGWFGIELPAKFTEFGANVIRGLVNGLMAGVAWLRETVVGMASTVTETFKGVLGIQSPSRVFMDAGGEIPNGAAQGILGGQDRVRKAAAGIATAAALAAPLGAGAGPDGPGPLLDQRAPLTAAGGAGAPAAAGSVFNIEIHAAPGMDPQAIARAVSAELDRRDRANRSRVLSSMGDID